MADRIDNPWHAVLDDALVCRFLLSDKNVNDPKQALNDIINWEIMVSQDPAVNGEDGARDLIQRLADALNSLSIYLEAQAPIPVVASAIKVWKEASDYLQRHPSEDDCSGGVT